MPSPASNGREVKVSWIVTLAKKTEECCNLASVIKCNEGWFNYCAPDSTGSHHTGQQEGVLKLKVVSSVLHQSFDPPSRYFHYTFLCILRDTGAKWKQSVKDMIKSQVEVSSWVVKGGEIQKNFFLLNCLYHNFKRGRFKVTEQKLLPHSHAKTCKKTKARTHTHTRI